MRAVLLLLLALGAPACPAIGADVAVAFSPRGGSLELVLATIQGAEESILVAAYSFTSEPVARALAEVHKRGVDVRVVADAGSAKSKSSAVPSLEEQGVPVCRNAKYAIMHNKFMVVDGQHVQTGSFNYTASAANRNAENVIVVRDAQETAERYAEEWARLWRGCEQENPYLHP